jgi:hypothetical protein
LKKWKSSSLYTNTDSLAETILLKLQNIWDQYLDNDMLVAAVILDRRFGDNWKTIIENEDDQKRGIEWIEDKLNK